MGFLIGHGTLKGHLEKLGLTDDMIYRYCEAGVETLCHLLIDCQIVAIKRARTLGGYQVESGRITFSESSSNPTIYINSGTRNDFVTVKLRE